MAAILPLPSELSAFIARPPPQALLVRGPPGTGKTTLALTLLQAFAGDRTYISGRVPENDLVLDYPWLFASRERPVTVIDWTEPAETAESMSAALATSGQLIADKDVAGRLRSLLLPPQVLEAWSRSSPDRPTMVVIDSWDSIVERHLGAPTPGGPRVPDRRELERLALAQLCSGPVVVVMVVEHPVAEQLEYLTNGVVSLWRDTTQDRLERWLRLDKLRGVRIESPSYPFSLEGGRFQCAARLNARAQVELGPFDVEPDRYDGAIWPGSSDWAGHFGRPHVGRLTLIVKDHQVPDYAVRLLTSPLITSILKRGGRTFHVLSPRFHPDDVWTMFRPLLSQDEFLQRVRVESTLSAPTDERIEGVVLHPRSGEIGRTEPRTPEALKFLHENPDPQRPNLSVMWTSGLRAMNAEHPDAYTPENLPGIAQVYLHRGNLHELFIGYVDDPLVDAMLPMAETHIRMVSRNGRVFVYGVDPPTPFLVLSEGDGQSPYRLLQVV